MSYVYGNDLISQDQGGTRTFYYVDGLGSTRTLTDASGNVVSTYNYEAFGEILNSTGSSSNKYLFAGEQYDQNLGDDYLRQRYYDPETGRFTRSDAYEGSIENPVSLNKYLYANANPITYIDPSGYISTKTELLSALEIADTLLNVAQFAINPSKTVVDFLLLPLDILGFPPSLANGLKKLFPNQVKDLAQGFLVLQYLIC